MALTRSSRSLWLLIGLFAPFVLAQESPPADWRQRIEALEARTAERDRRIVELEDRLARFESGEEVGVGRLETLIHALDDTPTSVVKTPKSTALEISGQLRLRGEHRTVKNYGAGVDDGNDFVLQRTRLRFDFRVLDDVRTLVEIQDSRLWGEEQAPNVDLEGVDVHQAFVDFEKLFGLDWTIRVGRQELQYGDQRLVSPLDWDVVGRAFDGVKTWYKGDGWQLDAFVTTIDENSQPTGGQVDDDHVFSALYFQYRGWTDHEIDVYLFYRAFMSGTFTAEDGTTMGDLEDLTPGFRFKGKTDGWLYSLEAVGQFGDRAGDDVEAYALAVTFGHAFDAEWKPTVSIEWTFASGDDRPGDGKYGTFDPLFPFGHYYQGFLDLFSWRNGHDFAFRFSFKPSPDWWVEAAVHGFVLDSDRDAWFNAGGAAIRRATAGGISNTVGVELDLHAKYDLNSATALWFGYSHFFPGGYVDDTGADPDTDWVYFQMTVSF